MNHDHGWLKVAIAWAGNAAAWVGVTVSGITLTELVLFLTAIFTALQIWKSIRDWRKERRLEKFEAVLKHKETE